MIEFKNTEAFNFEGAIRGMRNPLESWHKSDSKYIEKQKIIRDSCGIPCGVTPTNVFFIGNNDLNLMQRLIKAGTDHRKFLRQIMVSVDITAPDYLFKEIDTYKVGTVANSTSTMHKIMSKPFTEDMFSWDKCYIADWKQNTIANLNYLRARWLETKDKKDWYCLIQMLPMSYNYTRTMTLNYEVVLNMYTSRKNHKLDEWSCGFIEWAESLPYFKQLFIEQKGD